MKRALAAILLFALASAGCSAKPDARQTAAVQWWLTGPALPKLTGRVVDEARLLPADVVKRIDQQSAVLEARTGHQFVVVTLKSLHGQSIARTGLRLGRTWGIGRKAFNDGVLLIVAPNEGQVRIEVGYGLEKRLNDPLCSQIIVKIIIPKFTAGDMPGGIEAGAAAIVAAVS